jgi:phage/plasmid-associated DNA primase
LTSLIGRENVAGPTLNSLGGDFGLAPLLGKSLAIVSDARFVGRHGNAVVERLSSISGRIVLLPLTQSWLGKEDHDLEPALHTELTGVLNWALDGLQRLAQNGNRFTRLASVDEAITAMRDLASPVAAFVREKCELGPDKKVECETLFAEYRAWCEVNGHPKSATHVFGRDLRAAVPSIGVDPVKSRILGMLGGKARLIRFSRSLAGGDYFNQLTAERKVVRMSRGRPTIAFVRKQGARSEAIDCLTYGLAARSALTLDFGQREQELSEAEPHAVTKPPAVIRSSFMSR